MAGDKVPALAQLGYLGNHILRPELQVGVEDRYELTACSLDPGENRCGLALIGAVLTDSQELVPGLSGHGRVVGAIGRAVVDDNDLVVLGQLR